MNSFRVHSSCSRLGLAAVRFALFVGCAPVVLAQTSPADGPWSGSVQCELDFQTGTTHRGGRAGAPYRAQSGTRAAADGRHAAPPYAAYGAARAAGRSHRFGYRAVAVLQSRGHRGLRARHAAVGPRTLTLRRALHPPDTFADVFTVTAAPSRRRMTGGDRGGG